MIHIKKLVCVCSTILIGVLHVPYASAAFEYMGLGWPAATANIRVVGTHSSHFLSNPALMGDSITTLVGLDIHRPFQGLQLQAGSLRYQHTFRQNAFVHKLNYLGDEIFAEFKLRTGSAWSLEERFKVGALIDYHSVIVSGFLAQNALSFSLSSSAQITTKLRLASILGHIAQAGKHLKIPQEFHLGLQYEAGPATLLLALEKEAALPAESCLGFTYSSPSFWEIALGYRDLSRKFSAGWRIYWQGWAVHYVYVSHPHLTVSHGFGLEFSLP